MEQTICIESIKETWQKSLSSLAIDDGIELNTHHLELDIFGLFEKYINEHFAYLKEKESLWDYNRTLDIKIPFLISISQDRPATLA